MSTFKCGHERTPENSKPAGRWFTCRRCVLASNNASAKRRRAREKAERPVAPHKPRLDPVVASERRAAGVRRAASAKARERIEHGLAAHRAPQAAVRHAQFAIEAENAIQARLSDPVGQAKTKLQRRYRPVVSMAVYGGDPDIFVVGNRKGITRDELLAMADRIAA